MKWIILVVVFSGAPLVLAEDLPIEKFAQRLGEIVENPDSTDTDFAKLLESFDLPEEGFDDAKAQDIEECLRLIAQIYFMATHDGETDTTIDSKADVVVYAAQGVARIKLLIERHPEGRVPFKELGEISFDEATRRAMERERANEQMDDNPRPAAGVEAESDEEAEPDCDACSDV